MLVGFFAVYLSTVIAEQWLQLPLLHLLALQPSSLGVDNLWQLITYVVAFPPDQLFVFLIQLLFLWWMLAPFEERYGARRTLQLSAAAVLAGSISCVILGFVLPVRQPLFGASVLLFASITASTWSRRHSNHPLMLYGLFAVRPKQLLVGFALLSLLRFLVSKNLTELISDLSAMAAGMLFVDWMTRPKSRKRPRKQTGKRKGSPFMVIPGGQKGEDKPTWLNRSRLRDVSA